MTRLFKILLALSLASCGVCAQQYIGQDGHLLDANNRVGSMGWNGSGRVDALSNRSNNIISGNITGGMSFQGAIPYSSSFEFQGSGSLNTLGNFRRDSVGINQVTSGQTFGQYYVNSGQGVTTSYQGQVYNTQKAINFSVSNAVNTKFSGYTNSLNNSMAQSPYSPTTSVESSFASISKPQLKLVYNTTNFSAISKNSSIQKLLKKDYIASRKIDTDTDQAQLFTKENYILKYNQQLEFDDFQQTTETKAPEKDYEEQLYFPDESNNRIFGDSVSKTSIASQESTQIQLSARYQSYKKAGIEDMQKGRYYKAVDNFTLAQVYADSASEENVDALKYLSISRFAAGEYISASIDIYKAFNISLNQTMEPVIDMQTLFGSDLTVYYGVKYLEHNYELTNNQSLLLLLGYIEYTAGDLDAAKETITKLIELQPDNIIFTQILNHISNISTK